ncbi:MAG: DUF1566 domain-containing protein [Culturomica sp.]|jgi:hypothetical protein|nr:DUF1566 domain-containing protein [Culturomica sp.]
MKKLITVLGILLLCAMFSFCEHGNHSLFAILHGTISDINGDPVKGAAILLTPGGGAKITGKDGAYQWDDLEAGVYEMKVFKEGYQSKNQTITLSSETKEVAVNLLPSTGKLSFNKAYIDMGSNESNNAAGFSLINNGDDELTWSITGGAVWISSISQRSGSVLANSATALVVTIDRSRLSTNNTDNYTTLVVSGSDGSSADLLITVFGLSENINAGDHPNLVVLPTSNLMVQKEDISENAQTWSTANSLCENSTLDGYTDWRLPTKDELVVLYIERDTIGNFVTNSSNNTWYWSSTANTYGHWRQSLSSGVQSDCYDTNTNRCRCVRSQYMLPIVKTLPTTNVSKTYAKLNGRIENKGEPAYIERGFVYSKSFQTPTIEDDPDFTSKVPVSGTDSDYSAGAAGLTTDAVYYVRAYAINANGICYGNEVKFTAGDSSNVVVLPPAKLMVQNKDISENSQTWSTANSLCQNSILDGYTDWRLPTKDELAVLYIERNTIGNFVTASNNNPWYWSSTAYGSNSNYHWIQNFSSGGQSYEGNDYSNRCRCVRSME